MMGFSSDWGIGWWVMVNGMVGVERECGVE